MGNGQAKVGLSIVTSPSATRVSSKTGFHTDGVKVVTSWETSGKDSSNAVSLLVSTIPCQLSPYD
jgi:hypothetical protein